MSVNCFIRLATEAGIKRMSSFSKGCTFYLKSDVYKIAQIGSLPLSLKENLSPRAFEIAQSGHTAKRSQVVLCVDSSHQRGKYHSTAGHLFDWF